MAGSIETLVNEAMQLPPDQRLTLAHRILRSVEPAASSEIDAAWGAEISERIARYDSGGFSSGRCGGARASASGLLEGQSAERMTPNHDI
jgi:putative addiction module component (TIGR02574 family)